MFYYEDFMSGKLGMMTLGQLHSCESEKPVIQQASDFWALSVITNKNLAHRPPIENGRLFSTQRRR